jgi:hypothetical protein
MPIDEVGCLVTQGAELDAHAKSPVVRGLTAGAISAPEPSSQEALESLIDGIWLTARESILAPGEREPLCDASSAASNAAISDGEPLGDSFPSTFHDPIWNEEAQDLAVFRDVNDGVERAWENANPTIRIENVLTFLDANDDPPGTHRNDPVEVRVVVVRAEDFLWPAADREKGVVVRFHCDSSGRN